MLLLRKEGQFNDLSTEFRKKLEDKVRGFGKTVRYRFNISSENPDPEKRNGKFIWPNIYTLDPATFYINDPYEKNSSKSKRIGLVDGVDYVQGQQVPSKFKKIKVEGKNEGILKLDIADIDEHFEFAMYLEIHPKQINGDYLDKSKQQIFSRIDEQAAATSARAERSAKQKALSVAEKMSDKEIIEFADAMLWDSTQELELLRNQVEEMAEKNYEFFNDLVVGKNIEYQALVKKAIDRGVVIFNPAEYNFIYASNKQVIATLSPNGEKEPEHKLADWLMGAGTKEQEVFKKIKSLTEAK
jgi:hypothetical protein